MKIDNFSGDTVIVCFKGEKYTLKDEERITVENIEKGTYDVRVHRARIPMETEDYHEPTDSTDFMARTEKAERSQHVQLDTVFSVEINSNKSVLTVKTKVKAKEKFGIDAIFSGYSLEISGGKLGGHRHIFPNKKMRKSFISHQVKEAMIPVGFGGIFLLILGIIALCTNLAGKTVNIGGQDFSYPWSIGLTAIGLGFIGYTVFVIVNVMKNAKRFKE